VGTDTNDGSAIIIVDRDGRFLLQLRDEMEDIAWPGVWAIVGGAIQVGESPYQAAVREAEEEIGQTIGSLHLMGTIPAPWRPGESAILHLFCAGASFSDCDIVVGEGQDAHFFAPEEIAALEPTAPFVKPIVLGFVTGPLYERCMRDAAGGGTN